MAAAPSSVIVSVFLYLNLVITGTLGDICINSCTTIITELTSDPNLFTVDKAELAQTCLKVDSGIRCLREYLEKCIEDGSVKTNTHAVLAGLENVMQICNQSQEEKNYLEHTPCYKEALEDNKNCSMEFQKHISVRNPQQQTQEKIGNLCRYYEEYLLCGERAISASCGEDAVKYFHDYKEKLQLPMKNLCPTSRSPADDASPEQKDDHAHAEDGPDHPDDGHAHPEHEQADEPAHPEDHDHDHTGHGDHHDHGDHHEHEDHDDDDGNSSSALTSSVHSIVLITVVAYLFKI